MKSYDAEKEKTKELQKGETASIMRTVGSLGHSWEGAAVGSR